MSEQPPTFRPGELDDPALLPGEFRAFRRETRDSLEAIARALTVLARIEEGVADVRAWQAEHDKRMNAQDRRMDTQDERLASLEQRIASLETPRRRAATPRRKR